MEGDLDSGSDSEMRVMHLGGNQPQQDVQVDLEGTKDWLRGLVGPTLLTLDLDAWNVTTRPRYLNQYLSRNTSINLAHHCIEVRDEEEFKQWIFISSGGCIVRMPNENNHKSDLLEYLRTRMNVIAHKSPHPQVLNSGSPVITVAMMQKALIEIDVPRIRLNSYGMKCPLPLVEGNIGEELISEDSSLANLNTFDIGFTYKCDKIILASLPRRTIGLDGYPMLLGLGKGFGTVLIKQYNSPILRVKGYPVLVHALKATSQKNMKSTPKFTKGWRDRLAQVRRKLNILRENDPQDLCGFRFEATVQAKTLLEAQEIVHTSGCLTFQHYLTNDSEPHVNDRLQFIAIGVDEYFQHLEQILVKVENTPISLRNVSNIEVSKEQRQKLIDLQNALGWNLGKFFRPTRWDDPNAWWLDDNEDQASNDSHDVEVTESERYWIGGPETDDWSPKDLWDLRPLRAVPCPDCARDPNRIIPQKTKSMPYPYGSMVKVGGSGRLGLVCNNKDNYFYLKSTAEEEWEQDLTGRALHLLLSFGTNLQEYEYLHQFLLKTKQTEMIQDLEQGLKQD
ncbi:uncharacterized protein PGTG_20066 [Puccinia graminis f. sp. tritici CRL 75-36-700-3]|uniref:Uncharacterized protein n=1 Tax=Puccinia graminis f. sp. tritici (strain CRL 75-36-700-3 / race SCCL) TaxID=418459 RepID=E3NX79_PUCGT|nr:uncharacterized protein PGTG_20066 [Puccinia graminis f. sp. tritici CRL 75-36-700-3]EFP94178.1 hypothetical protein PGTG_20066 [Puccinia graminis f. sp. tritici CRL 75-36-700-3]